MKIRNKKTLYKFSIRVQYSESTLQYCKRKIYKVFWVLKSKDSKWYNNCVVSQKFFKKKEVYRIYDI